MPKITVIKLLIKHKISEIIIDTFFNKLITNFPLQVNEEYYIGKKFEYLMASYIFESTLTLDWYYYSEIVGTPDDGNITIFAAVLERTTFRIGPHDTLDDEICEVFDDVTSTININSISTSHDTGSFV